jgi:hypothetical protein
LAFKADVNEAGHQWPTDQIGVRWIRGQGYVYTVVTDAEVLPTLGMFPWRRSGGASAVGGLLDPHQCVSTSLDDPPILIPTCCERLQDRNRLHLLLPGPFRPIP